ncbi:MAG TPA: undecaprenyl-phosphate glucose phosphotransferase [bacterium]|nr:undecaprenyl-phosphate glucose phosphotransferase [Candidatus Omnitrophota bacterium]HOL94854.1 undecaprenyl-phosphate glucose phosphotransferase [bacterium]HPO99716.1 undecaprenyl-phosphate glucose phosphotransferase [bacterium]HXK93892.1 undecaprenyl-phosphate glucose phosphotransferase [bacterium]
MNDRKLPLQTDIKDGYYLPLLILSLADFGVFSLSFLAAYGLRFFTDIYFLFPPPEPPYIPNLLSYINLAVVIGIIGVIVFERIGLYERRVGLDRQVQIGSFILAILVTYIFLMALLFNYRGFSFSRLTVGLAIPLTCGAIVIEEILLQWTQRLLIQKGIVFQKTVLIGPLDRCLQINQKLQEHHGSKFQLIGYINTPESPPKNHPLLPCLGSVNHLDSILRRHPIDNVIIAMPPTNLHAIVEVMRTCLDRRISYRVIPELYELLGQRLSVVEVPSLPTILFGETPLDDIGRLCKRAMDIVLSSMMLLVAMPLMVVIAILVRLDSKGSIFYIQERVGSDGKKFYIYKFRSMIDQAERDTGPKWATANDPRTTRIGRFLRRYNLDELPQFLNVLRGDMSLVGPRPERPYFVDKFKEEIPNYMRRHMVKSGITGWAQVNGWRGDTSVTERTEYDIYYVENWSLLFDLKILWKTLTSFKNAY